MVKKEQETNNLLKVEDIILEEKDVKNLIYTIRGKQVMLDSDVAMLYHCGASLKDLGKKCFAINKMKSMEFINKIGK